MATSLPQGLKDSKVQMNEIFFVKKTVIKCCGDNCRRELSAHDTNPEDTDHWFFLKALLGKPPHMQR